MKNVKKVIAGLAFVTVAVLCINGLSSKVSAKEAAINSTSEAWLWWTKVPCPAGSIGSKCVKMEAQATYPLCNQKNPVLPACIWQ